MYIGITGFIGAGKDTVANIIRDRGFYKIAFADKLKDVCSIVFGWPRELLEGNSLESRKFRQEVDRFWAEKLQIPNFTPRMALQLVGTECFRNHFSNNIWITSVEREIYNVGAKNVVLSDCRFGNEIEFVRQNNGKIIRVENQELPEWIVLAEFVNRNRLRDINPKSSDIWHLDSLIHPSESSWVGLDNPDAIIRNNGPKDTLQDAISLILSRF